MVYKVYDAELSDNDLASFLNSCINRFFAILGIYEDCERVGNYSSFYTYIDRLCVELSGCYSLFRLDIFISLLGLLQGLKDKENLNHQEVKSIVFHCISLIKRGANASTGA